MTLLTVENLHVAFATRHGQVEALRGIDLALAHGETLGIVGESGSGKSVTSLAIMRLLDRAGRITAGRITFEGTDLTRAAPDHLRRLRGAAISMIFQNPRTALNPIRMVEQQIADVLAAHDKPHTRAKVLDLLNAVQIRDPERRLRAYPHELSGGMCQRIMIAMAIACEPTLLIADEPTTGLDVTTQKTVMELLAAIQRDRGMSMILITHDLGLAATWCDRIAVMEQGQVVEQGPTTHLFQTPTHPYTKRLVAASPTRNSTLNDLLPLPVGEDRGEGAPPRLHPQPANHPPGTPPLLELVKLTKSFDHHKAVDTVSLQIPQSTALGLVGESGSGKSTISRMITRLLDPDHGDIIFNGHSISDTPARDFHHHPARRDIQIVFQDPHDSLNPRHTAFDSIAHPLRRLERLKDGHTLTSRVIDAAHRAGLPQGLLDRFPHQLSGGQKARVGIARAIAPRPRLLVLDEPTAALDVSVQAVILQLLDRLRREDGIGLLFVSHDLNVVRMLCDDMVVLQNGQVVEAGPSAQIFTNPQTPYAQTLLAAIPNFDPRPLPLAGEGRGEGAAHTTAPLTAGH